MIFSDFRQFIHVSNEKFMKIENVSIGVLNVVHSELIEFPTVSSSIDISLGVSLKKLFCESVERVSIANKYNSDKRTSSYCLINSTVNNIRSKYVSFGNFSIYGHTDTTGVACRNNYSKLVLEKAIAELIEKNELIFFWYLKFGICIDANRPSVKYLLRKFKVINEEIYLFYLCNISNWHTVVCIMCKDRRIISTGICCQPHFYLALKGAIAELKIIKSINSFKFYTLFSNNIDTDNDYYRFIKNYKSTNCKLKVSLKKINNFNICIPKDVSSFEICYLNNTYNSKVISVISPYFLKCLPTKKNISLSQNVNILKYLDRNKIENHLDCIIS